MDKTKKNNRPLILSIISITICLVLLIGATIAWFTDTETNKGNTIEAGTLDIVAQWYDVYEDGVTSETSGIKYEITDTDYEFTFEKTANNFATTDDSMIEEEYWQSGDVNAKLVEVINNGTLAVNIDLAAVATDLGLEDSLWFDFVAVNTESNTTYGTFEVKAMSSLSDVVSDYSTTLTAGSSVQFILIYGMLESAGNTYQTDASEEIATSFTADIIVTATQTNTTEKTVVYAYTVADINGATTNQTVILMQDITEEDDVELTTNVNFDLNGYTLEVASFKMETDDYCTVDIANGTIYATAGDIIIDIENGTLNYSESTLQIAEGSGYIIDVTVSPNTVTYSGTCNFYEVDEDGNLTTATVYVNDGVEVIINEDAVVTANIETTDGETYVFINNGTLIGEATGATTEDGAIIVSGDEDALLTAMATYSTATAFVLEAGTYTAPTKINSSVTITGAGSTRLGSSEVTTLAFSDGLEISTDDVELTLVSLDLDADITTGKFNNGYGGIIELTNASNITLNIEDCYVVDKDIVGTTNYISASIYLDNVDSPTINVDNSYLLGRYTIMVASYTGTEGRGYSHNVTDAVYNITDSTLKGWTTGNMRGENTVYTATNCTLIGYNVYSGTSNSYSTFVMTDGSIDSTYTFNNCTITASNTGDMEQNCFSFQYGATNNTLYLNDCIYEMYQSNGVSAAVVSVSLGTSSYPDTTGSTVVLDGTTYEDLDIGDYLITGGELIAN